MQIAKKEEGVYEWVDSWLTTKGVMQVENEIQSENGQIKNFKIKQDFCANADKVYKSHKMSVALYLEDGV